MCRASSGFPEDSAERGVDTRHEEVGFDFLAQRFIDAAVEPVRLHVAAKRYLCAVDQAYLAELSPASLLSLELQGGPYDADEIAVFRANPYHADAGRLRRYDDFAKESGLQTPGLEHIAGFSNAPCAPKEASRALASDDLTSPRSRAPGRRRAGLAEIVAPL